VTTTLDELSDEDLARLCQDRGAKDNRPYAELFRRHYTAIWRVCYSFVGNIQDAEDLVQEVFFKAFRSLDQFEGRSAFKTWLYRIALNNCKNELRRRSRRPVENSTSVETLSNGFPAPHWLETSLQVQAPWARLSEALTGLRPQEQEAIVLKDMDQQSYEEIAQTLGISLSAAKMRVQRARLALRAAYKQLENTEEIL